MTDVPSEPPALVRPADIETNVSGLDRIAESIVVNRTPIVVGFKPENFKFTNLENARNFMNYLAGQNGACSTFVPGFTHIHNAETGLFSSFFITPGNALVRAEYNLSAGNVELPFYVTIIGDYEGKNLARLYLEEKAGGALERW